MWKNAFWLRLLRLPNTSNCLQDFAKIKNTVVVCESLFSDKPSHRFCRFGGGRKCTLSNVLNGGFKSLDDLSCLLTAPLPRLSPLQDLDRFGCSLAFSWDQPFVHAMNILIHAKALYLWFVFPVRNMNIFLDSHQQRTEMPWFGCTCSRILRSDPQSF